MKTKILLKLSISFYIILCGFSCFSQPREIVNLNQDWKFFQPKQEIDFLTLDENSWTDVNIPHTWNNKDIQSGGKVNFGTAWYKKNLTIEKAEGKHYFLRFDGVGQYAEVFVNKKFIGKHLGGYSAFVFEITDFIENNTQNTIFVKVNNELNNSYPKDNFLFGIYGGIYRSVNLIVTNNLHFNLEDHASNGIFVYQKKVNKKQAELRISCQLKNESSTIKQIILKNTMLKNGNKPVANELQNIELKPVGMQVFNAKLKIKNPRLWHGKNDPFLYTLKTEIFNNGELFDVIIQDVGIRYFEIDEEKGFILNGEPYKLYGVCRHQEWENIGNALLPEHHKTDMELINEIGATSIRLAHYQQDEYIYKLADSMGFLIWAEIPFVNGYKEGADDNALQQMTELIKQNFNHPSIFVWGVHNEVVKGAVVQEPVELTKKLHNLAKNLDPERYTVAVSNIWWVHDHEIHELTDLQGFNQYTGWYGGNPSGLENWIKNYHKKKPDIRTSISEYGAGGNINHQSSDLSPPSPKGKFFAEGYQTYYHEICWAAIEECPHIWASYVWNMFDFSVPEWDRGGIKGRNHKGLITYDRKMKKDAFFWYKANWADSPVLHIAGKRNDTINTSNYIVKAYCNFGAPELIINGKNLGKMQSGINSVQFVSKEIILTKRENKISVKARSGNKMVIEEFIIYVE